MKTFFAVLFGLMFVFLLFWLIVILPFFGWHYETGRGEHTGYITAVEQTGIFFKTGRAYVKTDTQSSQEDDYCVIDIEVFAQLKELSKSRELVKVSYLSYLSAGVSNCAGEGDIIYAVER